MPLLFSMSAVAGTAFSELRSSLGLALPRSRTMKRLLLLGGLTWPPLTRVSNTCKQQEAHIVGCHCSCPGTQPADNCPPWLNNCHATMPHSHALPAPLATGSQPGVVSALGQSALPLPAVMEPHPCQGQACPQGLASLLVAYPQVEVHSLALPCLALQACQEVGAACQACQGAAGPCLACPVVACHLLGGHQMLAGVLPALQTCHCHCEDLGEE